MSKLIELIKAYLPRLRSQEDREFAYLSGAVDIYDLERRMLEVDKRDDFFSTHSLAAGTGAQ
jgi:hypothetical protein